MLPVAIRKRVPADDDPIAAISEETLSEYNPGAADRSRDMVDARGAVTFVATSSRAVVGYAVLQLERGRGAHLNAIAVTEPARGRGVGRALLARIDQEAASRGLRTIRLATAEANVAALQAFVRAGYRICDRLPRYYERGQDAVRMDKRY